MTGEAAVALGDLEAGVVGNSVRAATLTNFSAGELNASIPQTQRK